MRKIQIVVVPVTSPEKEVIPLALTTKASIWEFPIASVSDGQYVYDHKVVLTNQGSILQILSKDANGAVIEALSDNAFDLSKGPLKLLLIDVNGDKTQYKLRIEAGAVLPTTSVSVLSGRNNPQLQLAEVTYTRDANIVQDLEFIGAVDIGMGFTARSILRPAEPFEIAYLNGDTIIKY